MMGNKKILFYFFLIVLFLPLLQKNFNFIKLKPLKGAFTLANKPDSIVENWFSGEYQKKYNAYFNDYLGFREELIRINNQIKFSVFDKVSNDNLLVGKNRYILDEKYILANLGVDYLGDDYWQIQVKKIKYIQEKLKNKYHVNLLILLAPSKISFYQNKIPERYQNLQFHKRNYNEIIQQFKSQEINFIDYNKWFSLIRDTSKVLFPKYGIHWSVYGSVLAADTLINYLKSFPGNLLPKLNIYSNVSDDSISGQDMDLLSSLNLLFKPQQLKMSYPKFRFSNTQANLKILAIGDSYYKLFQSTNIIDKISLTNSFKYYNEKTKDAKSYLNQLNQYNNLILINTELNYWNIGHGFIEDFYEELIYSTHKNELYSYFNNQGSYDLESKTYMNFDSIIKKDMQDYYLYKRNRIRAKINTFNKSFILKNELIKPAQERNISIEEMIKKQAIYIYENSIDFIIYKEKILNNFLKNNPDTLLAYKTYIQKKYLTNSYNIKNVVNRIKSNKVWFDKVKEQAKKENISVDDMLVRNAKYYLRIKKDDKKK